MRPNIRRHVVRLSGLAVFAFTLALCANELISTAVAPLPTLSATAPPRAAPRAGGAALTGEALARLTGLSLEDKKPPAADAAPPRTVQGLRLRGTLRSRARELSLATVEEEGQRRARTVVEGDTLGGYAVTEIGHGYVLLERDGEQARLTVQPQPDAAATAQARPQPAADPGASSLRSLRSVAEGQYEVDRNEVLSLATRLDTLSKEGLFVGHFDQGRFDGFALRQARAGGLFETLGLQPGDVIRQVNGTSLTDFSALSGAMELLGRASLVELQIARGGKVQSRRYLLR